MKIKQRGDILGKNLIIVPARSGSKGLKNKNLRSFNGQPLIYWSIEAAHYIAGLLVDSEIIFTSDSKKYIDLVKQFASANLIKIQFHMRTTRTSSDTASMADVVKEVVQEYIKDDNCENSFVILLQPTSPIRSKDDLAKAVRTLQAKKESTAIVVKAKYALDDLYVLHNNQAKPIRVVEHLGFETATRRQDQKAEVLNLDGSFYGICLKKLSTMNQISRSLKSPKNIIVSNLYDNIDIDDARDLRDGRNLHKDYIYKYGDDIIGL